MLGEARSRATSTRWCARRMIRVGVTFNRTFYFVDKGVQRGAIYEYGKLFEDELNKKLKTGNAKINVVFVPLPRDLLGRALTTARWTSSWRQVTIRPELQALVDFTNPTRTNVSEVVVTGPWRAGDRLRRRPVREGASTPARTASTTRAWSR